MLICLWFLFLVSTHKWSVLHLCTKFEADCSIRSNVIRGPTIWKLGHVTPATPTWGRFMIRSQGWSVLFVYTIFQADSSFPSKVVSCHIEMVTWPRPRPRTGRFIFRTLEGSVLHLYTEFEADCSIRSNVIRGSHNLEIKSSVSGHAHLEVVYDSFLREVPSSMSVPNFKQIALFVQKLLGVPQFRNWVTWPKPRPRRGHFMARTQ